MVGAVWTKGYPALKYEQTKVDDDDHGLIDEDEVRPQYMKPVYQTQVEYNDEQDLIAEDEPEEIYEQKSVDAFPKRTPSYGGKLKPEGKQGTYKGSDITSEVKHKKNSYESTKISQEEYEVKTVGKDFGDRIPSYSKNEAPKAYKTPEIPSAKGIYQKKISQEEEYAGHIGQSNAQHGSGIKQSYKPKPSYIAPAQEKVEVDLKSTSYKGAKGKSNSGYSPKQVVVDSGMRPGHYGSQGVYMGYSVYKQNDAYNNAGLDNKQKSTSYQAPQTYGIYREGQKQDYSSSHGSGSSNQGYGNTGYHGGQSNSGSYHNGGFNSANNEQTQYGGSGYGGASASKHQSSYGGSGSEYSGIGGYSGNTGSHLQAGSGYKSNHGTSYNGYKANENLGIKSSTSSGYGLNAGSHLQSGSGYKSNYDGYKSSGIKSSGVSGYGISAGSHLQGGSGYKGGYDASQNGYKSSGIKSTGSSGYGISSGSRRQSGSEYKSGFDAAQSGYKSSGNQGIKSSHASGYGSSSGSQSQSGLGYNSGHYGHSGSSHLGSQSYGKGGSASTYGSSHSGGAGYERGHQRNLGKSYHTSTKTYAPASYHNTKSDGYNQKSIKSSGGAGSYTGGIGESSRSGIKSSTGYHGSNSGISTYGNEGKKSAIGSSSHYPRESYQQPKLTQQKHVDDYLESGKSDDAIDSSSYKGIGETYKGHPGSSKTSHTKPSGSGIKGGPKTPKYPVEYQEKIEDKYQPSYGGSGYSGAPVTPSKGYSTKGGSGINGGPSSGDIEVSAKKSPYQPLTASHGSGGYSYPSLEQPGIGSSDKYAPKEIEQKDLSYEAVLGSPGTSSAGSGSGGYGFTSSGDPSSGSSGPVYGSDDKYEVIRSFMCFKR